MARVKKPAATQAPANPRRSARGRTPEFSGLPEPPKKKRGNRPGQEPPKPPAPVLEPPASQPESPVPQEAPAESAPAYQRREVVYGNKKTSRNERIRVFKDVEPDHGDGWTKSIFLAAGGMGIAFGYVQSGPDNEVLDTLVVKETFHEPTIDHAQWYGDFRNPETRQNVEIVAMERIRDPERYNACIQLRASDWFPQRSVTRVVTDYCHHGDLAELMGMYRKRGERISEPALWAIFNGLVTACHTLAHGSPESKTQVPGWDEEIIHRDIKPPNVFLDENDSDEFPGYPRVVLADYGVSVMPNKHDTLNPTAYATGCGTPDFVAPEALPFINKQNLQPYCPAQLNYKTNIWGIGATMMALMALANRPFYCEEGPEDHRWDDGSGFYSQDLLLGVNMCCYADQEKRPTLEYLRDYIQKFTGLSEDFTDHAAGLRTAPFANEDDPRMLHTNKDGLLQLWARTRDE